MTVLAAADQVSDTQLVDEVAQLGRRPYSELGIPMFLFGEDRVPTTDARATSRPGRSEDVVSQELRSAFERLANAWSRVRPNPTADDVAPLLEWMAERDFGTAFRSGGN